MFKQIIVTMTSVSDLSEQDRRTIAQNSVKVSFGLNLTGRAYVQGFTALAILEGPSDLLEKFITALENDIRIQSFIQHTSRIIEAREFDTYWVGIDAESRSGLGDDVYPLTPEFMASSLPKAPSTHVKMMVETYLAPIA